MEVAGGETDEFGHVRLGRHRPAARARDRAAHRVRDPGRRPRPHPARRHADRVRPRARDPLRRGRDRRRPRGALGDDAGAARHADRARAARRGGRASCARSRPRTTRLPRRSSASRALALRSPAPRRWLAAGVAAGCASPGSAIQAGEHVTVYVSMPLRGPSGADGRDVADGARLALADAAGEAGGARRSGRCYLDDTGGPGARARLERRGRRRPTPAGDRGLDRDRLPRRLRLRRHPRLAADHQRGRACSRSRRRARRSTWSSPSRARRPGPGTSSRPASAPSAG